MADPTVLLDVSGDELEETKVALDLFDRFWWFQLLNKRQLGLSRGDASRAKGKPYPLDTADAQNGLADIELNVVAPALVEHGLESFRHVLVGLTQTQEVIDVGQSARHVLEDDCHQLRE